MAYILVLLSLLFLSAKSFPLNIDAAVKHAANEHKINEKIIRAIIATESSFVTTAIGDKKSKEKSLGLMQIKLSTARDYNKYLTQDDLFDPVINVFYGTAHYKSCLAKTKDIVLAVDLYNRGIVAFRKQKTNFNREHIKKFLKELGK